MTITGKERGSHILALRKGSIPILLPTQYVALNSCVVSGLIGEAEDRQT
jgi:hypothetical protein